MARYDQRRNLERLRRRQQWSQADRGGDEEGRFCANLVICLVGLALVVYGVAYLSATSVRAPRVERYNRVVQERNLTGRPCHPHPTRCLSPCWQPSEGPAAVPSLFTDPLSPPC